MNPKTRLVLCVLLALGTSGLSQAWAARKKQAPTVSTPTSTPTPSLIDMQMEAGRVHYQFEGQGLYFDKDFQRVVDPLGDPEATRLLDQSRKLRSLHWYFGVPGTVSMIAALTGPDNVRIWREGRGNDWRMGAFLGGAVLVAVSGVMEGRAYDCRFNAVQRYNRVVRGETKVTLSLPSGERPVSVGVVHTF